VPDISHKSIPPANPDLEIKSQRVFDHPGRLVFKAWSEPEHLSNWWGPKDFTNSFEIFDFKEGGKWKFIMHGPDKGNYHNEVEFISIEQPYHIYWQRISKPLFKVAVLFTETNDEKTSLIFRMIFDSKEECDKIKKFAIDKNEENFDKLEEELLRMKQAEK